MYRTWTVLLLLLVAAAAAWFFFLREGPEDPVEPVRRDGRDAPGAPETPSLRGTTGAPAAAAPRGRGSLVGVVERGGAPAPARVAASRLGEDRPPSYSTRNVEALLAGRDPRGEAHGEVAAGRDGTFAFEGVPVGVYALVATASDGARGTAHVVLPASGARVHARIALGTGTLPLRGRVVDGEGRPLSGWASVQSGRSDPEAVLFGRVPDAIPLDDEGRFVATGLDPGPAGVVAFGPGYLATGNVELPRAEEYVITVAGGGTLRGRVVDASTKAAIAGATVLGGGGDESSGFVLRSTTTDGEGRFTLSVPSAARGGLMAHAPGYGMVQALVGPDPEAEVVLALVRVGSVRGRVATSDGSPLAGVTVRAVSHGERRGPTEPVPDAVTDGAGRFTMPEVEAGEWLVYARDRSWCSPALAEARGLGVHPLAVVVKPGEAAEVDLRVVAAGAVEGRVTGDGEPVAGAVLRIQQDAGGSYGGPDWSGGSEVPAAASDESGAWRIEGVVPGLDAVVVAEAPGRTAARSEPFRVASGETAKVDLAFPPLRWLDLLVTSARDGSPVPGARVTATERGSLPGFGSSLLGTWTTDGAGRAHIGPLPFSAIGLNASAPGFVELRSGEEVPGSAGDAALLTHTLVLEPGLSLAGTVAVPEGLAPQAVLVRAESGARRAGRWVHERAAVDPQGRWRLTALPAGSYEVTATATHRGKTWKASARAEAGAEDVSLALAEEEARGDRLRIRVLDLDGAPVPSGTIYVWTFHGERGHGMAGGSLNGGTYETSMPSADAEVWVEVSRVPPGRGGARVVGPLSRPPSDLEVRLTPAAAIEGRVVDGSGNGVRGVRVEVRGGSERLRTSHAVAVESTLTEADGAFSLVGVGDGDWALTFVAPSQFVNPPALPVRSGRTGILVTLASGVSPRLTVVDGDRRPVAGANVAWRLAGNVAPMSAATSDARGEVRLSNLDPQVPLALRIDPPGERRDLFPLDVEAWLPREEILALRPAFLVAGTVTDSGGRPVPRATVRYQTTKESPHGWSGVRADDEGRFEIGPLERGPVRLYAEVTSSMRLPSAPGGQDPANGVRTEAGDRAVRLVVDVGLTLTVRVEGLDGDFAHAIVQTRRGDRVDVMPHVLDEGRLVLRGLAREDRCSLWVGHEGGRYALGRDLAPQEAEVVLRLQPGLALSGRLRLPEGVRASNSHVTVELFDGAGPSGSVQEDGSFRVEGVPPGTWRVVAQAANDDHTTWYRGSAEAAAGGTVEVTLETQR